jgi:hypothetical protein
MLIVDAAPAPILQPCIASQFFFKSKVNVLVGAIFSFDFYN